VLGEGRAQLVAPEDPSVLAAAIIDTLRDRGAAKERADQARARFTESFEIGPIADATVAFYERASAL